MANSLNLQEIDQEQALNLARFYIKSKQNCFFFGRRGVGKSTIFMQAAKDCGMKINYINLSVIERPDLAGYPNIYDTSDVITFKSPYFLPTLQENTEPDSIILFDEVDKASPEITAPLLEILQFRKINGKPINAASCLLTGNLFNEGAYSNSISSALLDRGGKYILEFSFEKWLEWAKGNGIHDLILGFLSHDPHMTCGEVESTYFATPSPRGWVMASDALYKAKQLGMADIETVSGIISGIVGSEAGLKFKLWYEYYRSFEPKILSFIEFGEFPIDYEHFSVTEKYVFCVTLCHLAKLKISGIKNKNKQLQHIETVVNFFEHYNVDEEVQLIALRNSFPFEFIAKYKLYESKIFLDKSKKLQEATTFKK